MNTLYILDSTLRDGAQAEGISFSTNDKLKICKLLDELGISFIEGGNPASNQTDLEFFKEVKNLKLKNAKIVAFSSTRRKDVSVKEDASLKALIEADTEYVSIVGKASSTQVKDILGCTNKENLDMIADTISYLVAQGKKVIFDAEHFFDGYKIDKTYATEVIKTAFENGAYSVCLCDTNGGNILKEIDSILKEVKSLFSDKLLGVHFHNDNGLAVANSICGAENGFTQIQGTLLGFGERCGNTNLSSIIPTLELKMGFDILSKKSLKSLTDTCYKVADICNIVIDKNLPFIGDSAFAHKGGMHTDGVLKNTSSFEHISPELVGNTRKILLSEVAGKNALYENIKQFYPTFKRDDELLTKILNDLKHLEFEGYSFEGAFASFELFVKKELGYYKQGYRLVSLKTINELPEVEGYSSSAVIKISVNNETRICAGEGDGPVHALDNALRMALGDFFSEIKDISLVDYKVRVIDSGNATASKVRVTITSTNGKKLWTTVGVSRNIIEASYFALSDSIDYILNK